MSDKGKGTKPQFEVAAAYVSIIPSFAGFSKTLKQSLNQALGNVGRDVSKTVSRNIGTSGLGSSFARTLMSGFARSSVGVSRLLGRVATNFGRDITSTLTTAGSAGATALSTSLAVVGANVVGGGLNRALNVNESTAKLESLGYTGEKLSQIMSIANVAVDGTAHSLSDAVSAASSFLSSGVELGGELESVLANTVKLTDISGRNFSDIASIMSKNAAAGVVTWEDFVQIIDSGVPILDAFSTTLGLSAQEIKKMASEGKISFSDLNEAINSIKFDSGLYAAKNVKLAFKNVQSQFSKIGANLWSPFIDNLPPVLNSIRGGLKELQSNQAWTDIVNLFQTHIAGAMDTALEAVKRVERAFGDKSKVSDFFGNISAQVTDFKDKFKGNEGLLAGAGVALSAGLLSQLPIIGSFFSGITLKMGLLGGGMFEMVKDSDVLRDSLHDLTGTVSGLFKGFSGFKDTGVLKQIGDSLGGIVNSLNKSIATADFSKFNLNFGGLVKSVSTGFGEFFSTIFDNGQRIIDAISGVINAVSDTLSAIADRNDLSIGEWLGETVVKGIETAGAVLETIAPLFISVADLLATAITSDFATGVLGYLSDLAQWFAEHEGALIALGVTLGTLFVAGKLSGPLLAMLSFFKGGSGGLSAGVATPKSNPLAALAGMITDTLTTIAGKITVAAPKIIGATAVFSAVLIGLAAALDLAMYFELDESLKSLSDVLTYTVENLLNVMISSLTLVAEAIADAMIVIGEAVGTVWPLVQPVLDWLQNSFLTILETVADVVTNSITAIVDSLSDAVANVFASSADLVKAFATDGLDAGVGALSAATGITAFAGSVTLLAGAMALLTGSDALAGVKSFFVDDENTMLGQVALIGNQLIEAGKIIENLPDYFASGVEAATQAGVDIMSKFGDGLSRGLFDVANNIKDQMQSLLDDLSAMVSDTEFNINLRTSGSGYSATDFASGNSYTTNNNNYSFTSNNDSVFRSFRSNFRRN